MTSPGLPLNTRQRAFSVAIVGADGSGKTSVADEIINASPIPVKYLYMGSAIGSSNYALPTSRLLHRFRKRALEPLLEGQDQLPPVSLMSDEMKERLPSGGIVKTLGLLNRIAEEWYRQLILRLFQMRGYVVLCDRHFLFEYFPNAGFEREPDERLSVRIHHEILARFYPQPDLTIYLHAPPEVLHGRKPEWNVEHLAKQQQGIEAQGRAMRNFVRIDASQPFHKVLSEVRSRLLQFGCTRDASRSGVD